MAYPSVTYTFTNGTTADGTQVSQNFADLVAGLSDGTKDLSVKNIGAAGKITVTETTDTTSGITGSINTLGGLGVTKAIYCGSSITCVTSAIAPLFVGTGAVELRSVTTLTLNAGTSFGLNVANATSAISAISIAATGACTFPVGTHTMGSDTWDNSAANGNLILRVDNLNTSRCTIRGYVGGGSVFIIGAGYGAGDLITGAASNDLCILGENHPINFSASSSVIEGNITTGGVWTLAAAPSASNASQLQAGGTTAVTIFRNSAADTNTCLVLSRAGTNNGGEYYLTASDGGTSCGSSGTPRWVIQVNAGNTSLEFAAASDAALKTVTGAYTGGLAIVNSIPIDRYRMNRTPDKETYGMIAQKVQQYMPECVHVGEDGHLMLGLSHATFVMWNAIQELSAKVDAHIAEAA